MVPTRKAWAATLWLVTQVACLPGDERPPPARVELDASATDATGNTIETADGWTIQLEQVVTAIGNVELQGGDECNSYADTGYQWLIDFSGADREKVGLVFGLGNCSLSFSLRAPSSDTTVLGAGTSQALLDEMIALGSDAQELEASTAMLVAGTATNASGEDKRFRWPLRRGYDYTSCGDGALTLVSGQRLDPLVEIRAEELFRDESSDEADLLFFPFATADCDGDGDITLEELDSVTAHISGASACGGSLGSAVETLADVLYDERLSRTARLAGGSDCDTSVSYDDG
jgi:hypothetical protein